MRPRLWIALPLVLATTVTCALAQQKFTVGQKVTFEDKWNRYGGGTISGVVIRDNGIWYSVRIDKKTDPAFQENSFDAKDLQAAGPPGAGAGGADGGAPAGNADAPNAPAPANNPPQPAAGQAPAANAPAAGARPNAAGHWGNPPPPPRGSFKYGKPNPQPMLGRKGKVPPGSQEYFVGTPPGDESPIGRWYTRTGGTWTPAPGNKGDGYDKLIWGNPEVAELINVMPNGTWEMNDHGTVTTGKWYDIGFNVIRLVNMDDGCDWTASVYDKTIQFKGYNGITKEGNRY